MPSLYIELVVCMSQFRRRRAITRSTNGPRHSRDAPMNSTRTRTARPASHVREPVRIRTHHGRPPTPAAPNARQRQRRRDTPTTPNVHRRPVPDQADTATVRPLRDRAVTVTTRTVFKIGDLEIQMQPHIFNIHIA